MSRRTFRLAACVAAVSWLAGCASVSIDEAVQETNQAAPGFTQGQLTLARSDEQRQARADAAQQLLAKPLSMDDAVRLALANSPALQALVAQSWRDKAREELIRLQVTTDGHAPDAYRAATVRNLDPWYTAFGVTAAQKMYLSPDARVRVW